MDKCAMEQHIKELIYLKLSVGITEAEQNLLDEWVAQSPRNKERYERLMNDRNFVKRYEQFAKIDEERAYRVFQKQHGLLPVHRKIHFLKYAAMFLLPILLIGGIWMYYFAFPVSVLDETVSLMQQADKCGKRKATLIVEDGKEIELKEDQISLYTNVDESKGNSRSTNIAVDSEQQQSVSVRKSVHTLKTHNDSEYWLVLEDGTTVHLNYSTILVYPVHFGNHQRTVYLEGEAYFSVKEDKDRPFKVITPHGIITEYGTSFNVNTFAPNCTKVVLVEGSISVMPEGGTEHKIIPGELAILHASSSKVEIEKVDVEPYIAWNEGRFVFENCPLEDLMEVISNWYGVKVEFLNEQCKQILFTGDMNRYGSLIPVLRAIKETTFLEVEMNGNTIIIKECN